MPAHVLHIKEKLRELELVAQRQGPALDRLFKASRSNDAGWHSCFADRGLRLCNFVFQGGGVLGVAHLGFLHGMEHIGVRVAGVAGTSAGAIVSVLISAARSVDPSVPVCDLLRPVLWTMPAASFIDGPYAVRRLVKFTLKRKTFRSIEMTVPLLSSVRRVLRTLGLNSGFAFESWLADTLSREFRIRTIEELHTHLRSVAENLQLPVGPGDLLKVVATALPQHASVTVPIGVKLTFPQDIGVLATKYRFHSPALLARASMSVPVFFEPLTLDLHGKGWAQYANDRLKSLLADPVLEEVSKAAAVSFIDGGMLSNFPIDAFLLKVIETLRKAQRTAEDTQLLRVPTVGVTLVSGARAKERRPAGAFGRAAEFASAALDGMRHARDRDAYAISLLSEVEKQVPDIKVAAIDTGSHNWLNFQLSDHDLGDLYLQGLKGAIRFIESMSDSSDVQAREAKL